MFGMTTEQILTLVKDVLRIGGAILVTLGIASAGQVETITTALMTVIPGIATLAGTIWDLYSRRASGMIASTAALPEVHQVQVNSPALAASIPAPEVVPAPNPPRT